MCLNEVLRHYLLFVHIKNIFFAAGLLIVYSRWTKVLESHLLKLFLYLYCTGLCVHLCASMLSIRRSTNN